jgi:cellulose synthase/poly-beta-1,6-N-acetylglucosamine synthase-like glycosyltransferase
MIQTGDFLLIIFGAFIIFQLIWYLTKLASIFRYRPCLLAEDNIPTVTILVAARNEEKNLQELIPVLMSQDYPAYQVCIALDRCHDRSLEIMKDFEAKYPNLKTLIIDELPDHFSPKKYALTLGIKGAATEWVLCTDADCRPASDQWLRIMACKMRPGIDFVIGHGPYLTSRGWLGQCIQYETTLTALEFLGSALLKRPYMAVGRNLAIRRSYFMRIRGYNRFQHLMGGDDDLMIQHHGTGSNVAVVIDHKAACHSAPKTNWNDYLKQKKRHLSVSKYFRTMPD